MRLMEIASDLKTYLKKNEGMMAKVHSVFNEAINLVDSEGVLITLLSINKDLSPMSLKVDFQQVFFKGLCANEELILSAQLLKIPRNNLVLEIKEAKVWVCEPKTRGTLLDRSKQVENCLILGNRLKLKGSQTGLLPLIYDVAQSADDERLIAHNTYTEFIQDVFNEIIVGLNNTSHEDVIKLMPKFIGFGPGLTPSTDDFLAGIMAVMVYDCFINHKDRHEVLAFTFELYSRARGATTFVSEAMLKLAAEGKVTKNEQKLLHALFMASDESVEYLVDQIVVNGATSGSDFLLGVYSMQMLNLKL